MPVANVFHHGASMLCWTWLCVALHVSHGQHPAVTVSHHVPRNGPCFVDDIFAALRESAGSNGELTNSSLSLFGICTVSSHSVLLELAQETSRNQRSGLEVLHPTGVRVAEEDDRGTLQLTFDLPQSPLLKLRPVLLLALESPFKGGDLDVAFMSQSLQPDTQAVCISGETQYILLTGGVSESNAQQQWRISVETNSPDMKQNLKDILIGRKSGSNVAVAPLLLFSGGTGSDARHVLGSSPASSQTFSFLCELKRFLCNVLPQDQTGSPPLQLDALVSGPPLSLGLFSSETLLEGLINSSSPTVFSFSRWDSMIQVHHGQLALSPGLLEELRQRLEQIVVQIMGLIREQNGGHRDTERLGRLTEYSALPKEELAAGESQYRAFLLLKALRTVARAYEQQVRLRATRAGPDNPARGSVCGLRSLTISLEKYLVGPNTANINNCHGSCTFPLFNTNNHAVLLNSHIERENADERPPCCVPVAYDALEVVDVNEHGTYLSIKPDVVAKECGCR